MPRKMFVGSVSRDENGHCLTKTLFLIFDPVSACFGYCELEYSDGTEIGGMISPDVTKDGHVTDRFLSLLRNYFPV